jgi:hypothetical protein
MDRTNEGVTAKWLFWFSVLVAVSAASYAISRPITWLVRVVPDDTFYYLQIASNIAREGRSSFDGVNPTDGYHPGWMFLVVILAKLFQGKVALLRACLETALLVHVATGYCLSRLFRRWMSPEWSWIGGACWILNPLPVILALEGTEGSLYIFALTIAIWIYLAQIEGHLETRSIPSWNMACLGFAFGLCVLARTDQAILCVVVALALAWKLSGRARLRLLLITGGITILTVLPWEAYAHWATGAWFQRSGSMKMLWAQKEHTAGVAEAWRYLTSDWLTYPLWARTVDRLGHRWPETRSVAGAVVTLGLLIALWRGLARRDTRRLAGAGLVLMVGTLLTGAVYGLFFTDKQDWYRGQPGLILYIVLYGTIVRGFLERRDGRHAPVISIGGACVAISGATLIPLVLTVNSYPWQRDVLESQPIFERLVPGDQTIGCFNAGIPAYFSARKIVNLDGLVNNTVYPYYQRDQFDQYLRDTAIGYIADEDMSMVRAMLFAKKAVPMEVLATVPMTWMPQTHRHLWRVEPPSVTR